jgi:predicted peroxiredoxin
MTLGILVTTDKYRDDVVGITEAAVGRGHRVVLFFMDEGCRLITDSRIVSLKDRDGVSMSLCDFNRKKMGISDEEVPEGIICGSQYDNAVMNRESDKVIVF